MHPYPSLPHAPPGLASIARALALSLALHAALIASAEKLFSPQRTARAPDGLRVRLLAPPAPPDPAPAPPELRLEPRASEDNPRKAAAAPLQKAVPRTAAREAQILALPAPGAAPAISPSGLPMLAGESARKAGEQIAKELFYPAEAIERGLEGEALVLLFLDDAGNAIAARIETSSGHPLLDGAAVRAARTLKSLPAAAPREAVLPVRFRLR